MALELTLLIRAEDSVLVLNEKPKRDVASSSNDLPRRIVEWLDKQGIPLELRTVRALQKAGFRTVERGTWIRSPSADGSRPWRETDVSASEIFPLRLKDQHFTIVHQFECTTSSTRPWVVFPSGPDQDSSVSWRARFWSTKAEFIPGAVEDELNSNTGEHDDIDAPPLLDDVTELVSSVTEALRPNTRGKSREDLAADAGYKKVQQVLDASKAITSLFNQQQRWGIVLPVIVLGSNLYRCTLGQDGSIQLSKTTGHVTLKVERWSTDEPSVLVDIVTWEAFEKFAERRFEATQEAITSFPHLAKRSLEIAEAEAQRRFREGQRRILSGL